MAYGIPPKDSHRMPAGRRGFADKAPSREHGDNPRVHSKSMKRYPHQYASDERQPQQPADIYRDPVNGDVPVTHYGQIARPHVETVGWLPHTGEFHGATHPNADVKAAGNARQTHAPLEPVGQTYSKYGGEHGKPQRRPESDKRRGAMTAPAAPLNREPMSKRK